MTIGVVSGWNINSLFDLKVSLCKDNRFFKLDVFGIS